MSAHPVARKLVECLGEPLVATSANLTGQPAAVSTDDVLKSGLQDLDGYLDGATVDGGASTVVGLDRGELVFFREGPLSRSVLEEAWRRSRHS